MTVKVLRPISRLLQRDFIPSSRKSAKRKNESHTEFNSNLWSDYFHVLLLLLNSPFLQLENASPQRLRVAHKLRADIRGEGGELLRLMWDTLGLRSPPIVPNADGEFFDQTRKHYQLQFIPSLVGPFLELTSSPHATLRDSAIHLLSSMLEKEFLTRGSLDRILMECIERLDLVVMKQSRGDEQYRTFLITAFQDQFNHAESIWLNPEPKAVAQSFIHDINRFLQLCFTLRGLPSGEEYDDERMDGTLKLLKFIRLINNRSIYVKYVHELSQIHIKNGNFVEAAFTLKLHADLMDWNISDRLESYAEYGFPDQQSSFERKEQLYLTILDYLEEGKAWEKAVGICKELAHQYESNIFDYTKLSYILKRQAQLFESTLMIDRYYSAYFRVGFYGRGFPVSVRNRQFVYKGEEWEKIAAFCDRVLTKYFGSQLVKGNGPVPAEIINGNGMYIQIVGLQPQADPNNWGLNIFTDSNRLSDLSTTTSISSKLKPANFHIHPPRNLDNLPETMQAYYRNNEVNSFSFTRPFKKFGSSKEGKNEFLNLWIEKTVLYTQDIFPCLVRRSEVQRSELIEISPIENALTAMEMKNKELLDLERKFTVYYQDPVLMASANVNPFTMSLNGAVDAPVNGGVPMYKQAFLSNEYLILHPEHRELTDKLIQYINEQVVIIKRCLELHAKIVPNQMKPLHDNLITCLYFL